MSEIEKLDELEAYFHNAGKPRDRWRVGTEYEKVGIDRHSGKAIPYFGKRGVDYILRELIERFGHPGCGSVSSRETDFKKASKKMRDAEYRCEQNDRNPHTDYILPHADQPPVA